MKLTRISTEILKGLSKNLKFRRIYFGLISHEDAESIVNNKTDEELTSIFKSIESLADLDTLPETFGSINEAGKEILSHVYPTMFKKGERYMIVFNYPEPFLDNYCPIAIVDMH